MSRYRKRSVEIEAYRLTSSKIEIEILARWCGGQIVEEISPIDPDKKYIALNVPTLAGVIRAGEGDYIIRGVQGEFCPCKAAIFEETYEEIR